MPVGLLPYIEAPLRLLRLSALQLQRLCGCGQHNSLSRDSFSSGLLPALGARSSTFTFGPKQRIVLPNDYRYRWWENFLVVLVIYTAWMSPFELAFIETPQWPYLTADYIVNVFFVMDIVITFFVAYLDGQSHLLVVKRSQIAMRYLKTWFMLDIAATIPLQALALSETHYQGITYGSLNMLRLVRLRRVSALFAR